MKGPVTQEWVHELPMMQQTVLLTAVRGPDGTAKYEPVKYLLRWYRRCVLLSAMDGRVIDNPHDQNGGSFTGPSYKQDMGSWQGNMNDIVSDYLRSLDALPHHFQMHFMHAVEILGYKHPKPDIRGWWNSVYHRLVRDLHLWAEREDEMDARLGDNREAWLARNDHATVA